MVHLMAGQRVWKTADSWEELWVDRWGVEWAVLRADSLGATWVGKLVGKTGWRMAAM